MDSLLPAIKTNHRAERHMRSTHVAAIQAPSTHKIRFLYSKFCDDAIITSDVATTKKQLVRLRARRDQCVDKRLYYIDPSRR